MHTYSEQKRQIVRKNIRKTIPNGALPDGVHQNKQISQKWLDHLHKIMKELVPTIKKSI